MSIKNFKDEELLAELERRQKATGSVSQAG